MGAFTLDTSGEVAVPEGRVGVEVMRRTKWRDLDPFTQGYVEALFADANHLIQGDEEDGLYWAPRFSDLSPSALERIVTDCERARRELNVSPNHNGGWGFWAVRQGGRWPADFPPLTLSLDDAGKVTLADRVQA